MILENLKTAGVQQAHKEDRITFTALNPWPGDLVCGEGLYLEGDAEKRAAVFIGPEFGTVQRADLVAAAREAGDAGFDVLRRIRRRARLSSSKSGRRSRKLSFPSMCRPRFLRRVSLSSKRLSLSASLTVIFSPLACLPSGWPM